jgi:mandelate racemase
MNLDSALTVRGLAVRAVDVPMNRPLITGGGEVGSAAMVLIDLLTEEGITGCSYLFCPTPLVLEPLAKLLSNLAPLIEGDLFAPVEIERKLQQTFRLLGPQGLSAMAMAGIDMAAWDALAKSCEMPLVRLLGGRLCRIPAYNSCGLGMIGPERAAEEVQELLAEGFGAIKVRLGYQELKTDLEVVRAVRDSVGEEVVLMSDYNQSLSVAEAGRRAAALDEEGLYWIEEPTRADDYTGHARIRRDTKTPVQIGENWWGVHDAAKSIEAGASEYAMPDAMKIGGDSRDFALGPPLSGDQRAPSGGEPHEALAGVRRLGRPDPRGAAQDSGRLCLASQCSGDRDILERGSRPTILGRRTVTPTTRRSDQRFIPPQLPSLGRPKQQGLSVRV